MPPALPWQEIVARGALDEFAPLAKYKDDLVRLSRQGLRTAQKELAGLEDQQLETVRQLPLEEQKDFLRFTFERMRELFVYEDFQQRQAEADLVHLGPSLYRTFDRLDQVLGLSYEADYQMKGNLPSCERLYEGAGPGVQSGYSTVLLAIAGVELHSGDCWIDLGSGYGRVGLILGMLRPDVKFLGYEYVEHRVRMANQLSEKWGQQGHTFFHTQDLAEPDFQIPPAQVYYLYDPFSEATYLAVLAQLLKISRDQKIVIITKGNARVPLLELGRRESWPPPREFHAGNLCLFHSR